MQETRRRGSLGWRNAYFQKTVLWAAGVATSAMAVAGGRI